MAYYENPTSIDTTGTNDDDVFRLTDRGSTIIRTLDGAGGYDELIVDRTFDTKTEIIIDSFGSDSYSFGRIKPSGPYDPGVIVFSRFESFKIIATSGDDSASIKVDPPASGFEIEIEGGAGTDSLKLDASAFQDDLKFSVDASAIVSSFGKFSGFERFVIFGGGGDDDIRTGDQNDDLRGGAGSNILIAGGGDDEIYTVSTTDFSDGGAGSDYWTGNYSDSTQPLIIDLGDVIRVNGLIVAVNVENITLGTGSADDVINITTDNPAVIYGGGGKDLLTFRPTGEESYSVLINTTTSGELVGGINSTGFSGIEQIDFAGGSMNDSVRLLGIFAPDQIKLAGGGGTDVLFLQFDLLAGPTSFLANADGSVNSNRGSFSDFEIFSIVAGAESDTIRTGLGNDFLNGASGDDMLDAGGGNDVIYGDAGRDTMVGGDGDDLYYVHDADDVIVEMPGEGVDTVIARIDFTLAANVENLTISGSVKQGNGNAGNNILIGNDSDNILRGYEGDDTLEGGAGADSLFGGPGSDVYIIDRFSAEIFEFGN